MAMNLFAKKLSRQPIGTQVELTFGDGADAHDKISGTITDSDFQTSIEITTASGEERILDCSIIKGMMITGSLSDTLKALSAGTQVRFSYGAEENREPTLTGTITENDGESALEIRTGSGQELLLQYSLIRSLLIQTAVPVPAPAPVKAAAVSVPVKPAPAPAPVKASTSIPVCHPEALLRVTDPELKTIFDSLPRADRVKLQNAYDNFRNGIRNTAPQKMADAADQARSILFREDQFGFEWSAEAARFCGLLLCRTRRYDAEVFLLGNCFYEAALASLHHQNYDLCGAYALVAMLDQNQQQEPELITMLSASIGQTDDCYALQILHRNLPHAFTPQLNKLIQAAFEHKGFRFSDRQNTEDALAALESLYRGSAIREEAVQWLSDEEMGVIPAPVVQEPVHTEEYGIITRLNWSAHTGEITCDDGSLCTFRYDDVKTPSLLKELRNCMRSDLGGKTYPIRFLRKDGTAREIQPDNTLVDRARQLIKDGTLQSKKTAMELCKRALQSSDRQRALSDLVRYAVSIYSTEQDPSVLTEATALYEANRSKTPEKASEVMQIALCYRHLKQYPRMLETTERALSCQVSGIKERINHLQQYLSMTRQAYEHNGDKSLLTRCIEKLEAWRQFSQSDFAVDPDVRNQYHSLLLPYRVYAECVLDRLEDAEDHFNLIPALSSQKAELTALLEKTRARLAPQPEAEPDPSDQMPDYDAPAAEEETEEAEILPYEDKDGWPALQMTAKELLDYAMQISGPDRIPAILAYLKAGSLLNPQIAPVYRVAALAANDPMEAPDYTVTALVDAMSNGDAAYPQFNDCCMGAAFLRTSFLSGRGYDYSAQSLRNSIAITRRLPALHSACDALEQFRKETGRAIDIYADYRNHGVKQLQAELDTVVRRAEELHLKFIQTAPREGIRFARLLETKKIVFARDGYLASMLRLIRERDTDALEAEKDRFVTAYLGGVPQFTARRISGQVIDELINRSWEEAGKAMQLKKANATLQGDRRNNLRSNISDILDTICTWYSLSEQSAGLTWRTEQGETSYRILRPRLLEAFRELADQCDAEADSTDIPAYRTGLFLLAATAGELAARLDGSWRFEQEKYLYADFLRSDHVMLNDNFLPDLSATFCALPAFNILARIRRHVEEPKRSFQAQIDHIYSTDKTAHNYGAARKIEAYLQAVHAEPVTLPENADLFVSQSRMQTDMRFRSFRETYAMAMNYGQIMHSDAFCYTLEDTVRYWYDCCTRTDNYGFFTSILLQAEDQIHASARQYETQLDEQLDALIASNRKEFDEHPGYAEEIRTQIANQNFIVAEDWMARIRLNDFSLDVQQPEALGYLEQFWSRYITNYNRVADSGRSLVTLLGRKEGRNKDAKRAQQLIDCWLSNGRHTDAARITQLLNLLGWQNISAASYPFAADPRAEMYHVTQVSQPAGTATPLHPIAAFGSGLARGGMYVSCLYGTYDCDRLYEKIRQMDTINGSKIILLDYALSCADRRALARKLKQKESGLKNVYIVIDRVLICHLANVYNDNLINRILMAVAMPFSYCQPYVADSTHTMPPEIFIGRKDELLKIEQPDGVNLIYGGRQLGKSALFKKARTDLDGNQGSRAVLIDIKDCSCAAAALRLSAELVDLEILPAAEETDDWELLCRRIKQRLRRQDDPINYLLVMLDEADCFIDDCANYGYRPLVALKDIQQALPGHFKFVLAGLHNIVRFNRDVALGRNSVITHLPSLKITPFRTPEAQELLTGPLSYLGFSLPSKVTVSQILATVNYFPGLIQLYCQKLIESLRSADYAGYDTKKTPPYVITDEHLRRVMADRDFVEQIREKFEITLRLDQDQGSCYYPLALLIGWMYNVAPSKSGYNARDVLHHARDLSIYPLVNLDEEKIDALLQELRDLNILRSVGSDTYLLASKNFRDLLGSDEEIFEKLTKVGVAAA